MLVAGWVEHRKGGAVSALCSRPGNGTTMQSRYLDMDWA